MGTHTHSLHHGHVENVWRLWLAEAGVVILTGFGLYYAIPDWLQGRIGEGLMVFGWLVGAATVYAFGYLWCLPDVLTGTAPDQARALRQRWSDFALLSTFIAIVVIAAAYAWVIRENYSYVNLAGALALVLGSSWLLSACAVASEKYLSWTLAGDEARASAGWRPQVRRVIRTWGNWPVRLLGVKPAVAIGGALALVSLWLKVGDNWLSGNTGYNIIAGTDVWPMPGSAAVPRLEFLVVQGHRGVYALGLVVAVLVSLVLGRLDRIIRGSRILATLAGVVALMQVATLAVGPAGDDYRLGLWILTWVIPVAIWLRGGRGDRESWDNTRLAVMVFYLPVFFLGIALLAFFTYMYPGFGGFVLGMLLMWWGLVQSRREITQQQKPRAG